MTNPTNETSRGLRRGLRRLQCKLTAGRQQPRAVQALWNGVVVAESDDTIVLEGNHYFPPEAVNPDHLRPSSHRTVCPWKGVASYHDVVVDGHVNRNAAWYYATPSPAARKISTRVAFSPTGEIRAVD